MISFQFESIVVRPSINQELVQSRGGKERYLSFLERYQLSPLQQLFGDDLPENLNREKINRQYLSLIAVIQKDRAEENRSLCHRLLEKIEKAYRLALPETSLEVTSSPKDENVLILENAIKNGRWGRAERLLEALPEKESAFSPHLKNLAAIIYTRMGKCEKAAQFLSHQNKSWDEAFKTYESALTLEELELKKKLLEKALEGFQKMIPFPLFIELKSAYRDSPVIYEKYLRLAIRFCPDCLEEQKKALIDELKKHLLIKSNKFELEENQPADRIQFYGKQSLDSLSQLGDILSWAHNSSLKAILKAGLKSEENNQLEELISFLKGILDSHFEISDYIPSYLQGWFVYSSGAVTQIREWFHLLQGWSSYRDKDYERAIYNLKLGVPTPILGFIYLESFQYYLAIQSWGEIQDSQPEVNRFIIRAMNAFDLNYVEEDSPLQLGRGKLLDLDEIQLKALLG